MSSKNIPKPKLTPKQAIEKLWRMGNISYLLKGVQRDMRDAVYNSKGKRTVFLCSRRLGKTFSMLLIAVEYALNNPDSTVKILFPRKKDAKAVSKDQMKRILKDCPKDLMPVWKEADKLYAFQNGSEIQMAGTDSGNAESIRGSACHLAILDEAGFMDYTDFDYIVKSIIMPTLLTTDGKMILASTPSKEPDHPFMTEYVFEERSQGTLIEYDIHSNPLITEKQYNDIVDEYSPLREDHPDFQREFLLKCDVNSDIAVIHTFTSDVEKDIVRGEILPHHYDSYVSGDPAVSDLTVLLFGYYDFMRAKLVIADELVMGGPGERQLTTMDIANGVRRKESMLFSSPLTGEVKEPYLRIMDNNNPILINDLYSEHGLMFIATAKDEKEAQINKVNLLIQQGRIEINPKCKNLIYHLKSARWENSKSRTGHRRFARVKGNAALGLKPHHCDAVDALIYMVRNVNFNKNPFPDGYFEQTGSDMFQTRIGNENSEIQSFMDDLMNVKKKD